MLQRITSVQNPRIKQAARLRERRGRERAGRFLIDGRPELLRAMEAGITIDEVFVVGGPDLSDPISLGPAAGDEWLGELESRGAHCFSVTPLVFEKLAFGDRNEGVVATAIPPERRMAEIVLPQKPLVVVLEGVEKPGNLGAILRTADAAGVSAVISADSPSDLFNPNAVRASLGAIFTVPVCEATSAETISWLLHGGLHVVAARVDGAVDLYDVDLTGPTAIVLGSEAHGLSEVWRGDGVTSVRLPMCGRVDSLNVSTTAAAMIYEAVRQRRP